jgi:hypothetical protein
MRTRLSPDEVLAEVLARLGAAQGTPILITHQELSAWPEEAAQALQTSGILIQAEPAASVVCPGCEQACVMPVHVRSGDPGLDAFIICEERSDTNRVGIPVACLEQWQASGEGLARALAQWLSIPYAGRPGDESSTLAVGLLRGGRHSSHVQLQTAGKIALLLAGHSVPLIEVLRLEGSRFKLDHRALLGLVDGPVGPAGGAESRAARRSRLMRWIAEEKAKGNKAFHKTVANREGIKSQRLRQILDKEPESAGKPKKGQ